MQLTHADLLSRLPYEATRNYLWLIELRLTFYLIDCIHGTLAFFL